MPINNNEEYEKSKDEIRQVNLSIRIYCESFVKLYDEYNKESLDVLKTSALAGSMASQLKELIGKIHEIEDNQANYALCI